MSVSEDYIAYVLDQLRGVGPVTARRMFGGVGLYLDGVIFALLADDILYLKVDDSNRPYYEATDMGPFSPYGENLRTSSYYQVPGDVLEDEERLRLWVNKASNVAMRKASASKGKKA